MPIRGHRDSLCRRFIFSSQLIFSIRLRICHAPSTSSQSPPAQGHDRAAWLRVARLRPLAAMMAAYISIARLAASSLHDRLLHLMTSYTLIILDIAIADISTQMLSREAGWRTHRCRASTPIAHMPSQITHENAARVGPAPLLSSLDITLPPPCCTCRDLSMSGRKRSQQLLRLSAGRPRRRCARD